MTFETVWEYTVNIFPDIVEVHERRLGKIKKETKCFYIFIKEDTEPPYSRIDKGSLDDYKIENRHPNYTTITVRSIESPYYVYQEIFRTYSKIYQGWKNDMEKAKKSVNTFLKENDIEYTLEEYIFEENL